MDSVFGKGQSVMGIAMLGGSVAGGWIAQFTNLGVPYMLRVVMLMATFLVGYLFMRDWGWTPEKSVNLREDVRQLFKTSIDMGLRKPEIRWVMLAAPFAGGVGIYVFYAMQPHLLNLFGDPNAYGIAGLAAAIVAGAQILGGLIAPAVRRLFPLRTSALLSAAVLNALLLFVLSRVTNFWLAVTLVAAWALIFACVMPLRQAYLNERIPSKQRATVLSFDALMSSSGGVVAQPVLGRVADIGGYLQSFVVASGIYALAVPLTFLAHRRNISDTSKAEMDAT
jgi:predicted MFS family arabinose efflux permease